MNSKNGELSRAMRNRGIEIYLTNSNLLNTKNFIMKNFDSTQLNLDKCRLLNLFIKTIENQKDLKDKLTSKFFTYYLLYMMKSLNLDKLNEISVRLDDLKLNEELFSIRSLTGDTEMFILNNNLELINNLDVCEDRKIYESVAFRLILESTSKNIQFFLLNLYNNILFKECFDENMINHILNLNQQFLSNNNYNHQLDVNELTIDLRYSMSLIKNLITDHDTFNQLSLNTNIWSIKLFYNQLINFHKLNLNQNQVSLSTIENFTNRNQFDEYLPKLFIENLTKLLSKLNCLEFNLNQQLDDNQYIELRSLFNWMHHLISLCEINLKNLNDILIILDKFINLWIICFQKNIFNQLNLFNLDLNLEINEINESLNINNFNNIKDYDKLIKSFTYQIVPKNSNTSTFYSLIWKCMNEIFNKDYWFLLKNKEIINKFINIYKNLVTDNELERMATELKFINDRIRNPDAFHINKFDHDDDERKIDLELKQKFQNSQLTFEANLHSIYQMMFFVMEIQSIDLFNNQKDNLSILNNLRSLLISNNIIINPFHQYLFQCIEQQNDNKFELILHHFLDSFKLFRNDTTFNLVNFHDTFNLDLTKDNLTQYEFKLKGFLNDNYWYKEEFIANTSPVFTLILTKSLLQDNLRLGYLNFQQKQVEEIMKLVPQNYLNFFGTFLNSKIYYENLFECWVDLIANKTSDLANYQTLRNNLLQIIEQLKENTKDGKSNYLMSLIGVFTCKLFQPINALDPVQRSNCKLTNYELELNLIDAELELRKKFCKLNYGRDFNEQEDHPHIQKLSNRKDDLIKKINKLNLTQNFRPIPSLYFKLKSEINHFTENVICNQNFETSLICLKDYIDLDETKLATSELINQKIIDNIELMVNFKKKINYFLNDLLSKYSQYYDLLCNYLIGITLIYQSISWLLSNANKKLALLRLDINSKLLNKINHLFSYSNNEPNLTTDYLLSLLNSTKLTDMLSKTRSGLQHCHTMLYKATLMEILNAFAFQTDHNQTVKLMNCLIQKFLDTWKKQEEIKRLKQEEEEALYHYKIRNENEIVNDEEQLKNDINLNFPTFDDLYSDLMDNDENREFQLNKLEHQQLDEDDVYLKPEIILEIIDLHRLITESVCKETKLEFNFKQSFKLRYSILSELIETYGPLFNQTLDETVLDGHLIIYDNLNQNVFNQKLDGFNIYTDYNVDEIRKCFLVLEKLKEKIFNNLEDPMFCGHVTLRRLLKFILRIYSIQVTQPLIKFLTGLEIILKIAQDWEEIAPMEYKLINELEIVKELIISWRQIELRNYQNCLDNVFKRIRNQDFLKWWFHFYSMLTEILESIDNEAILNDFYLNLKKFIDESTIGEFSNRLILIENFILHVSCINSKHQVITLMKNLLNYYKQIEPKIIDHIKQMRKEFDDQIKDKVKIIKWKKVNYFGLKNLITKSHRIVMKNMNKFTRSLSEQSYLHFYKFNTMIEQPNLKWKLNVLNLKEKLIMNTDQQLDSQLIIKELKFLNNLEQFNQKCCKLIVKCLTKSTIYENRICEFNELSNDIVINIKDLQELTVDPKLTDKEQRKKQIKQITNKKDHQLSELIKLLKSIGLSYQKGLNHLEKLNFSILQTIKLNEYSSHLSQQSNSDLQSTEIYFYKLFNKFVYFLDASKLPSKDINQQKLDKFKGSILNLIMKIVKNRTNLSEQLDNFNQLNQSINLLGKLDQETILTKKLKSILDLIRNSSIQFKILLIQCKDVLNVLSKSSDLNEIMKLFYNDIPKLIAILDEISIPKSIPLFSYTKDEITNKFSKLNNVINNVIEYLSNLLDINNRSKNGVLMNTLQFTLELKEKINLINLDLELNKENINKEDNQIKFNELIDETEKFIQKVFFKVQEAFKYLMSNEFNEIKKDDDDKILIDLEKIDNLTKIIGLKLIKDQFDNYLERTQIVGLDVSLEECESIKKLLINLVKIINNYLVCVEHYINLYITKNRCLNKLTYILLGLFNELTKNGFCIPPDLQDQEQQNENDGQFKEIEDGGMGSGEGQKDVSDQIKNLNQIEGLENEDKNEESEQQEKPEEDDMKEEEKGIQMDDDFKGEMFDKDDKDDESDKSDEEENEMGECENDDNVLDENIWGKSDDESSEIDENEKGTDNKKGEEQSKEELVANEDNDNLDKSSKEDRKKEFDNKINEEEMNDEKQEDIDKNETDQFKKDKGDKNLDDDDLPENLELDDELEESENDEENAETKDDLEVSNLDENDEESSSIDENLDENVEEMNMSEKEDEEEQQQDKDENNENSDKLNLDDEIRIEKDEDVNEEMEVDDNDNALDNKTQNYDENIEFNEDLKNRNETMNQQQSSNEEQDSGLDKQQQKAFSYENKSSLITEQTINEDQIENTNDLNIEDNKNFDNNNKKLSDNKDKNLKRKDILKNNNKNKFKKEDKKPNDLKSDLYRHIDDNLSGEEDIIDKADESHSNNIEIDNDNEDKNKEDNNIEKLDDIEMLEEEINENNNKMKQIKNQKDETSNNKKDENLANNSNTNELDNNEPIISTTFIQRPPETIYHTDLDKLDNKNLKSENIDKLEHIDSLLERLSSNVKLEDDEVDKEAILAWRECEQIVSPLINELTAQLQLILEPTKTTKFKGDYKTGKRLNMRKIIPYIASQYRKDKIWLRRTKPSKREYQIMLALDDSGSMVDNHSKKLAFESLILLGKSLNLLEVGEIGIMSFGEDTKIINSFDEPFNDTIGSKLFSQFTFKQKKTRINDLLSKVKLTMERYRFSKKARELSQLLMIISDGRGLFSEGETQLKTKIKQIYDSGIFIVFLILDNPEHKDSICDIVVPKFESNGEVSLKSYMEEFPFPFYIIVRNIEQLPNVLGQALRQWFELVSVNDK